MNGTAIVVELTEEMKDAMLNLALMAYVGEECRHCGAAFLTLGDLDSAVFDPWPKGRISHRACFEKKYGKQK